MLKKIFTSGSVKTSLLMSFSVVFLLMLLIIAWGIWISGKQASINDDLEKTRELQSTIYKIKYFESQFEQQGKTDKNFAENNILIDLDSVKLLSKKAFDLISELENVSSLSSKSDQKLLKNLRKDLKNYNDFFELTVKKNQEKLVKETTLHELSDAIENTDVSINKYQFASLKNIVKDFFLKKDKIFVDKFKEAFKGFNRENIGYNLSGDVKTGLLGNQVTPYGEAFYGIVSVCEEIGLTPNAGLSGKLLTSYNNMQKANEQLISSLKVEMTHEKVVDYWEMFAVLSILISVCAVYVFKLASNIEKPITLVQNQLNSIAEGITQEQIKAESSDVLMLTVVTSLNKLNARLNNVMTFLSEIGKGNYKTEFELAGNKDQLGKVIIGMRDDLNALKIQDEQRNWANEGYSKFAVILREHSEIRKLGNAIMLFISKYMNANQGYFFIENNINNEQVLTLEAVYAYDKRKFKEKSIEIGEGLVGQCYIEAETIYMTDIPNEYAEITSGVGDSNPTSLLIVPIKSNDLVVGVIEIASFYPFEQYQIEFLEKIGESIASVLASLRTNENTKKLLDTTRQQAENMQMQEEEMRQNLEEMAAIQEDMERKEREYLEQIDRLNFKVRDFEEKIQITE